MARRTVGFKIGIVTSSVHFCVAMLAYVAFITSDSSTAALVFIYFTVLDAPINLLALLLPVSESTLSAITPLFLYGVLGSLQWFLIPWITDWLFTRVFPTANRTLRWTVGVVTIPLLIAGFVPLGILQITLSIRQERPIELAKSLGSPSSNFLTQRIVFDGKAEVDGVTSIHLVDCGPNAGPEILVVLRRSLVFLDDRYEEQNRIEFTDRSFMTVNPVHIEDTYSCQFIAYNLSEYTALLDSKGEEIWKFSSDADEGKYIEGVQFGDIDGNGRSEFAVYYRYNEGITLLDDRGETLWNRPVDALWHLEMKDVRGNGKEEILYSESGDTNNSPFFKILDADGTVVDELEMSTGSSHFAIIEWPTKESRPNILLTEENRIRIVDMQGSTVVQLDAPGCREWGEIKAVTVKFKKDEPPFLAVRKSLFPDIDVLYVYDINGKLVFQEAQVRKGSSHPALAAIPANNTGVEKLLVGASKGYGARVVEYSLTQ